MFINEKIVYLSLTKTGCTYTEELLAKLLKGTKAGRHMRLGEVSKSYPGGFSSRLKVGNVRNPWDWYVSLWAFGCMGEGALYRNLVRRSDDEDMHRLYSDVNNALLFREWLTIILSDDNSSKIDSIEDSPPIFEFAGLYTYRYLKQYTQVPGRRIMKLRNLRELQRLDQKKNFIDVFLKTENLDMDLVQLLQRIDAPSDVMENYYLIRDTVERNNSSRRNYRYYYDDYARDIIRAKDRYIVDKHGYEF